MLFHFNNVCSSSVWLSVATAINELTNDCNISGNMSVCVCERVIKLYQFVIVT